MFRGPFITTVTVNEFFSFRKLAGVLATVGGGVPVRGVPDRRFKVRRQTFFEVLLIGLDRDFLLIFLPDAGSGQGTVHH